MEMLLELYASGSSYREANRRRLFQSLISQSIKNNNNKPTTTVRNNNNKPTTTVPSNNNECKEFDNYSNQGTEKSLITRNYMKKMKVKSDNNNNNRLLEMTNLKAATPSGRKGRGAMRWSTSWLTVATCLLLLAAIVVDRQLLPVAEAWNLYAADSAEGAASLSIPAVTSLNEAASQPAISGGSEQMKPPSPLGRILEAAADHALGSPSNVSEHRAASPALTMLRPNRKSSSSSHESSYPKSSGSKQQAAAAEQQIINQHQRVHLSGSSHQRLLLPTKQRDQKVANSILQQLASDPATSDSRDSPLASLFGSFKPSAITSRSSIVKAISDNKLARSLSTVSKALGGNKYVAGAAAASALAALGLTVSKFLGPYFLATSGAYPKFGEPMLGASSYPTSSYAPASNLFNTDRNQFIYPSDTLQASGSSQQPALPMYPASSLSYPYSEFGAYESSNLYNTNDQIRASAGSYPQSAIYASQPAPSDPPYYVTYNSNSNNKPGTQQATYPQLAAASGSFSSQGEQFQQPQTIDKQPMATSQDSTSGHYTSFYAQNSADATSAGAQQYEPAQTASGSYLQQQQGTGNSGAQGYYSSPSDRDGRYSSNGFSSSSPQSDFHAQLEPSSGEASTGAANYYIYRNQQPQLSNNNNNQYENMMPAASVGSPSYSQPAEVAQPKANRKAGAVSLKMDEATRARLFEQLMKQQQQQPMRISTVSPPATSGQQQQQAAPKSANQQQHIAGVFVPVSSGAPSAEVYSTGGTTIQAAGGQSSRSEPNVVRTGRYIDTGNHAPVDNDGPMRNQQQPQRFVTAGNMAGYLILKPNTERQLQQQQQQAEASKPSSWMSLSTEAAKQQQQHPVWRSVAANKQIDESGGQQQPQQQLDYADQQVSDSAPKSRVVAAGGGGASSAATTTAAANGRADDQVSVSHRVSRTTMQSSAKVGARRPVERLTDYDVGPKGLHAGGDSTVGSTNLVQQQAGSPLGAVSAQSGVDKKGQKLTQHQQLINHRDTTAAAAATATSGDDSKTNLIHDEDNNKNNVIKLIDANINNSDKSGVAKLTAPATDSAAAHYETGLVIMSAPSRPSAAGGAAASPTDRAKDSANGESGEPAGRASPEIGGSQRGGAINVHPHNSRDHNSDSNQQQWTAAGKSQQVVSGDFPEMGTLTRSFSDFTAGD